jgi:hypothetical protein
MRLMQLNPRKQSTTKAIPTMVKLCIGPEDKQITALRRAIQAQGDYISGMTVGLALSTNHPVHPNYYKWWIEKGSPTGESLYSIINASQQIVRDYLATYGEQQ